MFKQAISAKQTRETFSLSFLPQRLCESVAPFTVAELQRLRKSLHSRQLWFVTLKCQLLHIEHGALETKLSTEQEELSVPTLCIVHAHNAVTYLWCCH